MKFLVSFISHHPSCYQSLKFELTEKIQDQYSKSRISKHFLKVKINIKNYHDLFSNSKSKSIVILTCFQNQNQEQFQESRSKFKNQDSCPSLVGITPMITEAKNVYNSGLRHNMAVHKRASREWWHEQRH